MNDNIDDNFSTHYFNIQSIIKKVSRNDTANKIQLLVRERDELLTKNQTQQELLSSCLQEQYNLRALNTEFLMTQQRLKEQNALLKQQVTELQRDNESARAANNLLQENFQHKLKNNDFNWIKRMKNEIKKQKEKYQKKQSTLREKMNQLMSKEEFQSERREGKNNLERYNSIADELQKIKVKVNDIQPTEQRRLEKKLFERIQHLNQIISALKHSSDLLVKERDKLKLENNDLKWESALRTNIRQRLLDNTTLTEEYYELDVKVAKNINLVSVKNEIVKAGGSMQEVQKDVVMRVIIECLQSIFDGRIFLTKMEKNRNVKEL